MTHSDGGVCAGDLAFGVSFKRGSPVSQGYTLCRLDPDYTEVESSVRLGYILAINYYAGNLVHDIREDEIVYPITSANRTPY